MSLYGYSYDFEVDGIYYTITSSSEMTVEVSSDGNNNKSPYESFPSIPETVTYRNRKFKVSGIGRYAFSYCNGISELVIPDFITTIGYEAFGYCKNLKKVILGKNTKTIESYAFYYTPLTDVVFSNSVKSIGSGAFQYTSLKSVVLPSGLETLDNSFDEAVYQDIDFPQNLKVLRLEGQNRNYYSVNKRGSRLLINNLLLSSSLEELSMKGVENIDFQFPKNLKKLTLADMPFKKLTIPEGIDEVNLSDMENLESVTLPDYIPSFEIRDMPLIRTLKYPKTNNIWELNSSGGMNGFYSLEYLEIPDGVTSIPDNCFQDCWNLKTIKFGKDINYLENDIFRGCMSLENIVFTGSNKLTIVNLDSSKEYDNLGNPYTRYYSGTFRFLAQRNSNKPTCYVTKECLEANSKSWAPVIFESDALDVVVYENKPDLAIFTDANGMVYESDIRGDSVSAYVPTTARAGMMNDDPDNSFYEYYSLVYSKEAPYYGFSSNASGDEIVDYANSNFSDFTLNYLSSTINIPAKVYNGGKEYKVSSVQNPVSSIPWYYNYNRYSIYTYSYENIFDRMHPSLDKIESVSLADGITEIGEYAFMNYKGLTSVSLPSSLKKIGSYAFSGCESLQAFYLPEGLEAIGASTFNGCKKLVTVKFPSSLKNIGRQDNDYYSWPFGAFHGCESLVNLEFGENISFIDNSTFEGCTNIETVVVKNLHPEAIADDAFPDVVYLFATLYVPKGTKELYKNTAGWNKFQYIDEGSGVGVSTSVSVSSTGNGTVVVGDNRVKNGSAVTNAEKGSDVVVTFVPEQDYELQTVLLDGQDITDEVNDYKYVLGNISEDHMISATFVLKGYSVVMKAGMSTLTADVDLDFSDVEGLRAYTVVGFSNNRVDLARVKDVHRGTGLLLMGAPGEYRIPFVKSNTAHANYLKGVLQRTYIEQTDGENTNFILGSQNGIIAFYKVQASGGYISAGKAYLQIPTYAVSATAEAKGFKFNFLDGEDATGIDSHFSEGESDDAWYNMQGQKIVNPTKGIYIHNGKKVIIK